MKRIAWTSLITVALALVIVGCAGEDDRAGDLRSYFPEEEPSPFVDLRVYILKYGDLTALLGAEVEIRNTATPALPAFPHGDAPSGVTGEDGAADVAVEEVYWNSFLAISVNGQPKAYLYTSSSSLRALNDRAVAILSDQELADLYTEADVKLEKGSGTVMLSVTDASGAPVENGFARLYTMDHAVSLARGDRAADAFPMAKSDDFAFLNVPAGPNAIVVQTLTGDLATVEFEVEAGAVTMVDVCIGCKR